MIIEHFIDAFGSVVSIIAEKAKLSINFRNNSEINKSNP